MQVPTLFRHFRLPVLAAKNPQIPAKVRKYPQSTQIPTTLLAPMSNSSFDRLSFTLKLLGRLQKGVRSMAAYINDVCCIVLSCLNS